MTKKLNFAYPLLVIAIIDILLYSQTLFFDYTNYDDNLLIKHNLTFISDLSNIPEAFRNSVFFNLGDVFYRPILTVWLMLNAQLGGSDLFIYHLSSILLHGLAVCLVFFLLTKLNYSRDLSLFLALLFLVHPALAQAVAWISGVGDILTTIFLLSSFIFFLDFIAKPSYKYLAMHLLFFALALFTKETAVCLLMICVIYPFLIVTAPAMHYNNKKKLFIGWLIVLVLWFFMRHEALIGHHQNDLRSSVSSLLLNLPAFIQYIGKILFPFNLGVMPVMKDTSYLFGIAALIVLIAAFRLSKKKEDDIKLIKKKQKKQNNFLLFGLVWFVVFLLPTFVVIINNFRIHQFYEHRLYFPLIGFLLMVGQLYRIRDFSFQNRSHLITGVIILCFLFTITFYHSQNFKDTMSFYTNAVKTSPSSSLVHHNIGMMYHEKNMLKEAVESYKKALALNPYEKDMHSNMGIIYKQWNMLKEAEQEFILEIQVNPATTRAYGNLERLRAEMKKNMQPVKNF